MSWDRQFAKHGDYQLNVWKKLDGSGWSYFLWRWSKGRITTAGRGTATYKDVSEAREAAVLHLATLLPTTQSERLLSAQSELIWEPHADPRKHGTSRQKKQ